MQVNDEFKARRDQLQLGIYKIINPAVQKMIKAGITPNIVTTIGFLGSVIAAVLFVCAANSHTRISYGLVLTGGFVMILFALFDMLDGQVARLGNMQSRFGALYDSVLDRYSELFTVGSIAYMMLATGHIWGALITFLALVGSIMVSYVRARAEGLGIECKVGLMQRPERVVLTSLAAIITGIVGLCGVREAVIILTIAMGIIALLANYTACIRIHHCYKELNK